MRGPGAGPDSCWIGRGGTRTQYSRRQPTIRRASSCSTWPSPSTAKRSSSDSRKDWFELASERPWSSRSVMTTVTRNGLWDGFSTVQPQV